MQCPPQAKVTKESLSMTNNYSDCNKKDKFEAACAGLLGVAVAILDISVSSLLDY